MPNPHRSTGFADETLPAICLITADEEFQGEIEAVLVDIDTQGEEAHAGVRVLRELRILERGLVLISLSRSRARGVEKQAVEADSDAHFHSPIDPSELRLVLKTTLEHRIEEMERARMQQQVLERSKFRTWWERAQ